MVVEGDIVLKLFVLGGVMYASGDVIMEGDSARRLLGCDDPVAAGGVSSLLSELSLLFTGGGPSGGK